MNSKTIMEPDTKNPSLKKYFQYMVNSRKLTIQFTQSKIREIIEKDLMIEFSKFSELLKSVSVEAFAFYIQGWPGWQPEFFQQCLDDSDKSYKEFKKYLKDKILKLVEKEKDYCESIEIKKPEPKPSNVLLPPNDLVKHLPKDNSSYKMKLPYTLEITGRPNLLNQIYFEQCVGQARLNFKPMDMTRNYSNIEILNHPFVHVQFKVPLLIKFTRKNVHKIEMFLCKPTDFWTFPKQDHIVDIRKFPARTNIYTWKFMQTFFQKLYAVMSSYNNLIPNAKKIEIMLVCNEFLKDIAEANLNFSTIQECTEVCYIIGDSMYYSDSAKKKDEPLNFRKIYSPQVQYSLVYCSISQTDISPDGNIKALDPYYNKDPNVTAYSVLNQMERQFIDNISTSLQYTCCNCNVHFHTIERLKHHIALLHPCTDIVSCTKCKNSAHLYELMARRWNHKCSDTTEGLQKIGKQ